MHEEEKKAFAKAMIDGQDPMRAAFTVFPTDGRFRMVAALQWEKDLDVIKYSKEILGITEPEIDKKEEHVNKLKAMFDDKVLAARDRLQASQQICQIEGFIQEKKEINTTINNKILIVPRSATPEEWEKSIKEQQEKLVANTLVIKEVEVKEVDDDEA